MNLKDDICQVEIEKTRPLKRSIAEYVWLQIKDYLRRSKRSASRLNKTYKRHVLKKIDTPIHLSDDITVLNLQKGETVLVKTVEEIKAILDEDGKYQGCSFTREMWPYCGKEMVVFKRVDMFLNETNNKIQKISNTVLLENTFCSGKRRFGEVCDRSCFLFWKEAWLKRK